MFCFFGLMSCVVYINGMRVDGWVWCGWCVVYKVIDLG